MQDSTAMVAMPPDCYILKTSDFTGKFDRKGRKIWKHRSSQHPYYLVWDELHGEIEVFLIRSLVHVAVYRPNGDLQEDAIEGRVLKFRGGK